MSYGSQTNTVSTAAHAEVTSESEKGAVMLEISQRNPPRTEENSAHIKHLVCPKMEAFLNAWALRQPIQKAQEGHVNPQEYSNRGITEDRACQSLNRSKRQIERSDSLLCLLFHDQP